MTRPYVQNKLHLDPELILKARILAKDIVDQITPFIFSHSTVSVERTVLRLFGINGIDQEGIPLPNVVVDHLKELRLLEGGAARILAKACLHFQVEPQTLAERLARAELTFENLPDFPEETILKKVFDLALPSVEYILQQRHRREDFITTLSEGPEPHGGN